MPPALEIVEGPVSPDDEHMSLSYGSFDTEESPFPTVARVSPPRNGVITLELLVNRSTPHDQAIMAAVRGEVSWLFIEKGERNPWGYAQYHSTTSANIYGLVHWSWIQKTPAENSKSES